MIQPATAMQQNGLQSRLADDVAGDVQVCFYASKIASELKEIDRTLQTNSS
jgi:hypothetical protein